MEGMWIQAFIVLVVALISVDAKSLSLEEFMSQLSKKSEENDSNDEIKEENVDLMQLMKRSGFHQQQQGTQQSGTTNAINAQNLLAALQALQKQNRQQNLIVYSPEYLKSNSQDQPRATRAVVVPYPNELPNYQNPSTTNVQTSTNNNDQLQNQVYSYTSQGLAPLQQPEAYNQAASDTTSQINGVQDTGAKDDRQGQYAYDAYNPVYGESQSRSPVSYGGAEQYSHQPVGGYKQLHLPAPSLSIKLDPFALLKMLLQKIPRPLFNLNGRVFLGLELGKGVGLATGKAAAPLAQYSSGYSAQPSH